MVGTAMEHSFGHGHEIHPLIVQSLFYDDMRKVVSLEKGCVNAFGHSLLLQYIFHVI